MISIKPLFVCAGVGLAGIAATSTVSVVFGSTGGGTTGVEAAVIAVTGLATIGGILGSIRWAVGFWERQDPPRREVHALAGFCEHGVGMLDQCDTCCPPVKQVTR